MEIISVSKLVFCETSNWWATKFHQMCGDRRLPVEEMRLLDDLQAFENSHADALIAIAVNAGNIGRANSMVRRIIASRSACRCVALTNRELQPCSALIRGVGFIDVYSTPLELPRLARLTKRHLALSSGQNNE